MEHVTCLFCATDNTQALLLRREPRHVICKTCGLVYLNPRMTAEEYNVYYEKVYWEGRVDSSTQAPTVTPQAEQRGAAIVNWVKDRIEQNSLVVEVGCGRGDILYYVQEYIGCQGLGIEPSEREAQRARDIFRLNIIQSDFANSSLNTSSADLIIMSHVLEHFLSPFDDLANAHRILKPGGYLAIEVPNIARPNPHKNLRKWLAIEHPYYYTPVTIARLLAQSHYKVIEQEADIYVRVLAQKQEDQPVPLEYPNEYWHVRRALIEHELRYWPRQFGHQARRLVRLAARKMAATMGDPG